VSPNSFLIYFFPPFVYGIVFFFFFFLRGEVTRIRIACTYSVVRTPQADALMIYTNIISVNFVFFFFVLCDDCARLPALS
jgi:hypothetical protein